MSNNILQIIQAIPQILQQAKGQYVDDKSILEIANKKGIDINNVLGMIQQYKSNPLVNNVAKQFGLNIEAVEKKFMSLVQNNTTKNNRLDNFR